jgi:hypothetical protein
MARKPDGDLGTMAISKTQAAGAVPFAAAQPGQGASGGGVKSLTVKLDGPLYAELRAYSFERERALGKRVSHQEIMVQALRAFLADA